MNEQGILRPPLPARLRRWWRREVVGEVRHAEIVARIDDEADWSLRYMFMVLMSAGIAVLGLLQSSPAVVIGAMLISPLMGPIIGLGFALAVFEWREVRISLTALALGSVLGIGISALIVLASPLQGVTPEILARTRPNLFDLLIAIFSALAGTYATIRGQGATVVGVAIATALMPPLAVVGYGLATLNFAIFGGALALYFTNFIAIALTAALMARLYGFAQDLTPRQTRTQTLMIFGVFLLMAAPLGFALRQIAQESIVARQLRSAILAQLPAGSRISQLEINHDTSPVSASAVVITPRFTNAAEAGIGRAWLDIAQQAASFSLTQLVANQDLPRLEEERAALAEAGRAAASSATATGLLEAVSLATGTPESDILIYPEARRLVANVRPGETLASLYAAEQRLAARHPDWQIRLIPPPSTRLVVGFAAGSAEPLNLAAVAWALQRWNISRATATGRIASNDDGPAALAEARANAVVAALAENGVTVAPRTDLPGPLQRAAERTSSPGAFRTVTIDISEQPSS
jgi:uncharacterized hydrophobic protein (TIGR00271 family)